MSQSALNRWPQPETKGQTPSHIRPSADTITVTRYSRQCCPEAMMSDIQEKAMSRDYEDVMASYHRCEQAGGLFDTFYAIFFAKSPEIPPKFINTDMQRQKQVVMASLLWVLRLYCGDPIARREVLKIADSHSHRGLDIKPEFYGLWLDALCESVAKHDPKFTKELERKWRHIMGAGINLITALY